MIDKQIMKSRFSKSAKSYDRFANVQKKMAHHLLKMIQSDYPNGLPKEAKILEIGCGTGYLTRLLRQLLPHVSITAVDIAPGMIKEAKDKLNDENTIYVCADIEEIELVQSYDLIISNATFQWFTQAETTLRRLTESLNTNGILYFSTFGQDTFCELNEAYCYAKEKLELPNVERLGQRLYSLHEWRILCNQSLMSVDYHISACEEKEYEYFDCVRDFFTSIRKIGANNSNAGIYCQSPSFFKELIQRYEGKYAENGRVKVTYHCIYFQIRKMPSRKMLSL